MIRGIGATSRPEPASNRRVSTDLTIPENICPLLTGCDEPTVEDFFQEYAPFTTNEACNYILDEVTCNPDTWELLFDPYNPYGVPGTLNSIPGIGWDPNKVPWNYLGLDAVGILGDIIPPAQPGAETLEALSFVRMIGKTYTSVGLSVDIGDLIHTASGDDVQADLIDIGLDAVSLVPGIGLIGSSAGILYNLSKGLYLYDRNQTLYGPPAPP